MADARVPMDVVLEAFGVPAVVTRPAPDNTPISTTVAWLPPLTEDVPAGVEFGRREAIRVLAIDKGDVATVPRGTTIVAPLELDGDDVTWRVEAVVRVEDDCVRVIVIEDEA